MIMHWRTLDMENVHTYTYIYVDQMMVTRQLMLKHLHSKRDA